MKYFIVLFLFILGFGSLFCQGWQENIKDPSNFYSIRQAYLEWLESEKKEAKISSLESDGEETKFRRSEFMLEPRVYPTGKLPSPGILWDELKKFNSENQILADTIFQANWTPLESPTGFPYEGYSGRLNCIAFHPLDTNTMFVGSPAGGLWKTTDGGNSWVPKTDYLPSLGVSEIVIHPENPDIMYMATGDKDAANFISNPYSYGLLKSTDGGETWDTTGLKHVFSEQMTIQRLIMHPTQPNILLAAVGGVDGTKRGIWRTTDAGVTWTKPAGGAKYDVEFNPGDPNIVYASGWKTLLRSTDAGVTWTDIKTDSLPKDAINYARIAVTPANPHIVFAQFLNPSNGKTYGLYKSGDDGVTWSKLNNYEINTQGGYDWTLSASPVDTNIILWGGQELFGSYDGGKNQLYFQSGHVDHHGMDYHPVTKALFNCNDGGIYKSFDNAESWENLNKGLQTFQYYRMGSSASNEKFILTGAQDNGTQRHDFLAWQQIGILADGTECIVDYSDPTIFYLAYQYGYMMRFGGEEGFSSPPNAYDPRYCAWVSPYIIHPAKPATLFFGGKDIYKTTDRGNEWTAYSSQLTVQDGVGGGMLRCMAISESNPDSVLYAASYVVVYRTTNAGATWQNITSNLPASAGCFDCSAISSIAVHPTNQNIAWVTMSGYSDSNRVFMTTSGGSSWVNISENLPAVPVNTIVYQKNSKDVLYIGTDLGVFFKDSTDKKWKQFMTGLPNVPIQELEIHYASGKIRAATFGRGLWESNLYGTIESQDTITFNFGVPITVDGIVSAGEWDDASQVQIISAGNKTVKVYFKNDGNNFLFLFKDNLGSANIRFPEIFFDMDNDKSQNWLNDDWWFHVSSTNCVNQGAHSVYNASTCKVAHSDWEANNFNVKLPDIVEIKIPFQKVGYDTSQKTIGIAFDVTNTSNAWEFWPPSADIDSPLTWSEAVISFKHTLVDDDFIFENNQIRINPNPAYNFIELPDAIFINQSHVTIYSLIGELVYNGKAEKRIDISNLSPGIYFIKVKDKVYKFVKM